jgi:hypothetical protein
MIRLTRRNRSAIALVVDQVGLNQLCEGFELALGGASPVLRTWLDRHVLSAKRGLIVEAELVLKMVSTGDSSFRKDDNQAIWFLTKDDLTSGIEQLARCSQKGYFSPAEFLQVQVPSNKELDWIYAEFSPALLIEKPVQLVVLELLRQGFGCYHLVYGIAFGLSLAGNSRLQIMAFFWDLMQTYQSQLTEDEMDILGDFCFALLGRGPVEHTIRLHGDPQDLDEFVAKVDAEVRQWQPPTSDTGQNPKNAPGSS